MFSFLHLQPQRIKSGACGAASFLAASAFVSICLWFHPVPSLAQESEQEVVANLAAGRVVFCVASDAIVLGSVEGRAEPGSQPPLVLPLGRRRIGVLLGAAEWVMPASGHPPVRLDRELPRLAGEAAGARQQAEPGQAGDIESIGVAFLERLRALATSLHRKLEIREDEPVVELILAGYAENYGPEVWSLKYRIAQDVLRGDYWRTRVLRPSYTQLYPPEKGQPRTLIEVRYPPEDPGPALLELLNAGDPRLIRLRSSGPHMARVADRLSRGESHRLPGDDAAAFLRAVLPAVFGSEAKLVLAVLHEQRGFEWLLPPDELPQKAEEEKAGAPARPTLRKKP